MFLVINPFLKNTNAEIILRIIQEKLPSLHIHPIPLINTRLWPSEVEIVEFSMTCELSNSVSALTLPSNTVLNDCILLSTITAGIVTLKFAEVTPPVPPSEKYILYPVTWIPYQRYFFSEITLFYMLKRHLRHKTTDHEFTSHSMQGTPEVSCTRKTHSTSARNEPMNGKGSNSNLAPLIVLAHHVRIFPHLGNFSDLRFWTSRNGYV